MPRCNGEDGCGGEYTGESCDFCQRYESIMVDSFELNSDGQFLSDETNRRLAGIAAWESRREEVLREFGLWEEFGDRPLRIPNVEVDG